jgi:pimeloyl-ACP methyl ester carboxylesterase
VQAALRALSVSAFFAGLAERAMLFDLQQVRRYFDEPDVRDAVQQRLAAAVDNDTCVLIGHSLGSVVAYEALCAHPDWPVRTLVTLGSPLGIRSLIFERLRPPPVALESGALVGRWPGKVNAWTNIADAGDVVALEKDLRPLFGNEVVCHLVHNGSHAHYVQPYLTTVETGTAVLAALATHGKPGELS